MSEVTESSGATQEEAHRFKLDDFEGPLDLLLFLIRKNEINIYDIPLALITEQYLEILRYNTRSDLEDLTEFYLTASTLLYLKSRMLLPVEVDIDAELEDPRRELVEKLIEYQKFRKLTELMAAKEDQEDSILERKKSQGMLPFANSEDLWEKIEIWDLLKTFSGIMKNLSPERVMNLYEEVSVNEKIALMYELLNTQGYALFSDLLTKNASIMDIICSFLAILESAKMKTIIIQQNRIFGDIRIVAGPSFLQETGQGE